MCVSMYMCLYNSHGVEEVSSEEQQPNQEVLDGDDSSVRLESRICEALAVLPLRSRTKEGVEIIVFGLVVCMFLAVV